MNLLLLEPAELRPDGTVCLQDARAQHLRGVQRARPGTVLRAGLVDGPLGTAEVLQVAGDSISLRCRFEATAPPRPRDVLLLAHARPKVLARCLAAAASLGFGRILVLRTWRVDKSHLQARVLEPAQARLHLLAGLAQACRTQVPVLRAFARFRPFVEDELDALATSGQRFVADPDVGIAVTSVHLDAREPLTLAIGPERGFTPFEVELLATRRFTAVRAGAHPLRVETALAVMTGALRARAVARKGSDPG